MGDELDFVISLERRHRLDCEFRFSCKSSDCPSVVDFSMSRLPCFVPPSERNLLERDWDDINSITWKQVFTFEEAWVYVLLVVVIGVFLFYVIVLARLLLRY